MIANTIFLRHSGRPVAPPEAALSVAAKLRTSFAGPGLTTGSLMEIRWAAAPAIGIWPSGPKSTFFPVFRPFYTTRSISRFHHRTGVTLYYMGKNAVKTGYLPLITQNSHKSEGWPECGMVGPFRIKGKNYRNTDLRGSRPSLWCGRDACPRAIGQPCTAAPQSSPCLAKSHLPVACLRSLLAAHSLAGAAPNRRALALACQSAGTKLSKNDRARLQARKGNYPYLWIHVKRRKRFFPRGPRPSGRGCRRNCFVSKVLRMPGKRGNARKIIAEIFAC